MSDVETIWLVVAGVLGLAVIAFVTYLIVSTARHRPKGGGRHRAPHRKRPHRDQFRTEDPEPEPKKRAAVIVQHDGPALRAELTAQCIVADWDEPLWLPAPDLEAAATAARQALEAGVDVVCVRGDSAIDRGVAGVLAGTETPLAFLPAAPGMRDAPTAPSPGESGVAGDGVTSAEGGDVSRTGAAGGSTWPKSDPAPDPALTSAMATALTGQNTRVHIGRAVLAAPVQGATDGAEEATKKRRLRAKSARGASAQDVASGEVAASEAVSREAAVSEAAASEVAANQPVANEPASAETPPGDGPEGTAAPNPAPQEVVFLSSLVIGDVVPLTEPPLTTKTVAASLVKGTSFLAGVKPDDEEEVVRPARSVTIEIGADTPQTEGSPGAALDAYLHASQSFKGWIGVTRAMMRKASRGTPMLVPMRSIAFTVTLDRPAALTIDGLPVGSIGAGESTVSIDRSALVVRR